MLAGETLRANPMAKTTARTLVDITFQLLPVITIVPDPFTVHADGKQLLQNLNLPVGIHNPFRHGQTHGEQFEIDWFGKEIVHPGPHGIAEALATQIDGGQKDEIRILLPGTPPDSLTQLQPVQPWHHPVTQNHTGRIRLKRRPSGIATTGDKHFVSVPFQTEPQAPGGSQVIFSEKDFHKILTDVMLPLPRA
jgi:hypothetical protein